MTQAMGEVSGDTKNDEAAWLRVARLVACDRHQLAVLPFVDGSVSPGSLCPRFLSHRREDLLCERMLLTRAKAREQCGR